MKILKGTYSELLNYSQSLVEPNPDNKYSKYSITTVGSHSYMIVQDGDESTFEQVETMPIPCERCGAGFNGDSESYKEPICSYCKVDTSLPKGKFQRQVRLNYLTEASSGTPIEDYVDQLLERYAVQVNQYKQTGSSSLVDAINNESDEYYLGLLAIELPIAAGGTITVKESILTRLI